MIPNIFIQVSSYDPDQLRADLDYIDKHHHMEMGVILNEIGNEGGLHTNLSILSRYVPEIFTQVFIGSHYVPWRAEGSGYREGMLDSNHRWRNLKVQSALWDEFLAVYANYEPSLYIDHEGVLNLFDEWDVRAAYTAYLIQSVKDAHKLIPNVSVLWSPAIWSGVELTGGEELGVARAFTDIRLYTNKFGHKGGITHLYLQDMMGRGRADVDLADVQQWYQELDKADRFWSTNSLLSGSLFQDLGINMELFTKNRAGQLVAETPEVITDRQNWYANNGVPVRAGWELRWWMKTHTHETVQQRPVREVVAEILTEAQERVDDVLGGV